MKKTLVLLASIAGATFAGAAESSYAVSVDFPYVSKYVFRGVEINKGAFQPSIEVSSGNGYAGLWTNFPVTERDDDGESTELDFYAGYNFSLSDDLKLDVGATYYYYPQVNKSVADSHSLEGYLGLNYTAGALTPSLYVYRDFDLDSWTYQGSLGYSIPLKEIGTSLDLTATIGYSDFDSGFNWWYYSIGANIPYKLSDAAKLNVGVSYAGNDADGIDDPGFWFTAGLTVAF